MKTILLVAFALCTFSLGAQHTVKGWVSDSIGTSLPYTSIALTKQSDSSLVSFGVSNHQGAFVLAPVPTGHYRLQFSYMGYKNMFMKVEVDSSKRIVDLGKIVLEENNKLLQAVSIEADAIPIVLKKDTIEYNAAAFKTEANAVVEDLLKELPGVEVDKNGKIKAQGKEVEKITVDGKEFFANDPKLASKNLPADVVDKVQVYDKKSEAAEFTGIDDGERTKTINLKLKDDKKNGYFGLIKAAYGNEDRFAGTFNLNRFTKKLQLSTIGMSNNINEQGFDMNDYIHFMGGIQNLMSGNGLSFSSNDMAMMMHDNQDPGTLTSAAGGINANYTFSKNTKLNVNYFHNTLIRQTETESEKNYVNHTYLSKAFENTDQKTKHYGHRINLKYQQQFDSTQFLFLKGALGYNSGNSSESGVRNNYNLASDLATELSNSASAQKSSLQYNLDGYYKYKFGKAGRIGGIRLGILNEDNSNDIQLLQNVTLHDTLAGLPTNLHQNQYQKRFMKKQYAELSYTEPLWKKHFVSTHYRFTQTAEQSDHTFYDIQTNEQQILNPHQSNKLSSQLLEHNMGLSWKTFLTNLKFSAQLDYSMLHFSGKQNESHVIPSRDYTYLLPSAFLRYTFSKLSNIYLQYHTQVNTPDMRQLQPTIDNAALSHYYIGNPVLDPEYVHRANVNFQYYSMFSDISLFASLQGYMTEHHISNSVVSDTSLIPTYKPVNKGEGKNLSAFMDFSAPIKKLGIKFNINGQSMIDKSPFLYNTKLDYRSNYINTIGMGLENRKKKHFDVEAGMHLSHHQTLYQNNGTLNSQYLQPEYFAVISIDFSKTWNFKTSAFYLIYPTEILGYEDSRLLWHAEVSRSIFHKKLKVTLSVNDILNQNNGLTYLNQYDYYGWQQSNTIGRFFMLRASYNLSAFGK